MVGFFGRVRDYVLCSDEFPAYVAYVVAGAPVSSAEE